MRDKGQSIIEILDDYTVIDIETTGLTLGFDEIIEIGAIQVRNGKEVARYEQLVQPYDFSIFDTDFTGISIAELMASPHIECVIPSFMDFIKSDVLVGANLSSFDINFLYDVILQNTNKKLQNNLIDIFRFSRKLIPELGNSPSVASICDYLGFVGNHHRAIDDCVLEMRCYEYFKEKIRKEQIEIKELFRYKNHTYKMSDIHCTVDHINEDNLFFNKVVAITGTLPKYTRKEALGLVKNMGGKPTGQGHFKKGTNFLVIGKLKETEKEKGTKSIKSAQKARLNGENITTISGEDFVEYYEEYYKTLRENIDE